MARTASGSLSIKFIDEVWISVESGAGGQGAVSFRREKFVPAGGPDGGNGGRGGDVIICGDRAISTLLELRYRKLHRADKGRPGGGNNCTGADGQDALIRVPIGTQIYDEEEGVLLGDITQEGQTLIVAHGGRGGRGNATFATPSRRSPDFAQPGEPSQSRSLRLELKLLADVGLIGFPNAGKSTLVSRLSRAKPRIADYPFTTLKPNLGVVKVDLEKSYVIADLPGLIEGAADGAGLGIQFLKHIERCKLFLFLVTQDIDETRNPLSDFEALRNELKKYNPKLLERPYIIALSQTDRPEVMEQLTELRARRREDIHPISAVTGFGLEPLRREIANQLRESGTWSEG